MGQMARHKTEKYLVPLSSVHNCLLYTSVSVVACPLWAAIVEANEADSPGADYFVKKRIDQLMLKLSLIHISAGVAEEEQRTHAAYRSKGTYSYRGCRQGW